MTTNIFTKKDIDALVWGDLFFGTGGGLPEKLNREIFEQAFSIKEEIQVIDVDDLRDSDFLISAYGVGDPASATSVSEDFIKGAIEKYKNLTDSEEIKAIIPGEISAESLSFLIAAILDLPVVNSDLVGGRAAPEIYMDCFTLFGEPIVPILGVSPNEKEVFLRGNFSAQEVEKIMRGFFADNGSSGEMVGYPIKAKKYKEICMKDTILTTREAGKSLLKKDIDNFLKLNAGEIIFSGVIQNSTLETIEGFTKGSVFVGEYEIVVKNENMKVVKGREIVAKAPEIIILLDKNLKPIHNSLTNSFVGKKVSICKLKAQGYWQQKENADIWKESL